MMYSIEKGITVPAVTNRGKRARYPWAELKINDSFFAPCEGEERFKKMKVVHASLRSWLFTRHMTLADYAIVVRRVNEGGVEGIRVWRLK